MDDGGQDMTEDDRRVSTGRVGRLLASTVVLALVLGLIAVGQPTLANAESPAQVPTFEPWTYGPVDTNDREAVQRLYREVIEPALEVPAEWTGNPDTCVAGAVSTEFRQAELDTLNAVRALAGLNPVTEDPTMSANAQQAALIMLADGALSHYPSEDWQCYTQAGYDGASTSNLSWGSAGAESVLRYMLDTGEFNAPVGHRRWLLYPRLTTVGMGDTYVARWEATNALAVIGGGWAPAGTPQWSPWPTGGYFPDPLMPQTEYMATSRWSLTYPGADFSSATVSTTLDGDPIAVDVHEPTNGYGDNTLVWEADTQWREGGPDQHFDVRVDGVVLPGGSTVSHSYSTTVFSPFRPAPSAPRDVLATPLGLSWDGYGLRVSWLAPSDSGGSPVTRYEVRTKAGDLLCQTSGKRTCDARGLELGQTYSVVVTAWNRGGASPGASPAPDVRIAFRPEEVFFVGERCRASTCKIRWRSPDTGLPVLRYEYRLNRQRGWTTTTEPRLTLTVPRGRPVTLTVRAVNALGVGPARWTSFG